MPRNRHGIEVSGRPNSRSRESIYEATIGIARSREKLFFKALRSHDFIRPVFFLGIRRATPTEDAMGTDFFMKTTEGEIPFDVKTSALAVKLSLEKKRVDDHSIDFIVSRNEPAESIRQRAFEAAIEWRAKYLKIVEGT